MGIGDSNQNVNNKFEIDSIKYFPNEKDLANPRLQDTNTGSTDANSSLCICNLDLEKIKQLQKQDEYITKIIDKGKSTKMTGYLIIWMSIPLLIEKSEIDQMFSMQLWSLMLCNNLFYMKATCPRTQLEGIIIIGKSYINIVKCMYTHVQNAHRLL